MVLTLHLCVLYNEGGVFTVWYALSPYIQETGFVFKGLI